MSKHIVPVLGIDRHRPLDCPIFPPRLRNPTLDGGREVGTILVVVRGDPHASPGRQTLNGGPDQGRLAGFMAPPKLA